MEQVQFANHTLPVAHLALDQNLPDERGDGLDGIRHGEQSDRRQSRVRQTSMHAFADGPDPRFAGQCGQRLHREIGHHVIELPHQSLIRTEYDCADGRLFGANRAFRHQRRRRALAEKNAQSQFHGPIVVGQARTDCSY